MMSLNEPHRQALGSIEAGLAGSDRRLASMLTIFNRLAAGEEMPAREKTRLRRRRSAARRPRRARRHPRPGRALPQPRRRYPRLGWQQAMLLLWVVITQLRARPGGPAGVLAPHMPTAGAVIAADRDQQRRRAPPQRLVRQPPGHAVARRSLASAAATPPGELAGLDDPAGQHRTTGLDPLTRDLQAEFVKTTERAQVRAHKGGVRRVAPVGHPNMSGCRHAYRVDWFRGRQRQNSVSCPARPRPWS